MTTPALSTTPTMLPRLQTIHDSLSSRKLVERSRETSGRKDREMVRVSEDGEPVRQVGVRR